ncbi:hypothetical protein DPMN_065779 [Dreissena polymorpha]|uniref:Uncharacterized protein n=1 Tax=Dreissena polymorpha TaxID=45954 RepID=A0A9D3YST1_DREPO|nr:hypothetical protein DPMN_065779 [Dreissena polymorpha]
MRLYRISRPGTRGDYSYQCKYQSTTTALYLEMRLYRKSPDQKLKKRVAGDQGTFHLMEIPPEESRNLPPDGDFT